MMLWPIVTSWLVPSAHKPLVSCPPHLQGHRPGAYVRLRFTGVPCELVTNFDPRFPILVRWGTTRRWFAGCCRSWEAHRAAVVGRRIRA